MLNIMENSAYRLSATMTRGRVTVVLYDKSADFVLADGPIVYRANKSGHENPRVVSALKKAVIACHADKRELVIRGKLAGLDLEHVFTLPASRPLMEERLVLRNNTGATMALPDLEVGFLREVADATGNVSPLLAEDRWCAIPFRRRADSPDGFVFDFTTREMVITRGSEPHPNKRQMPNQTPSRHRWSEGWAWTHGDHTFGIFTFSQAALLHSVVSLWKRPTGSALRFGGACMLMGEPSDLTRIAPGDTVELGLTRYQTLKSDHMGAMYAYRMMLDEMGCRFPPGYNPPVHWEQLYDMDDGAWNNRLTRYTKDRIHQEAQKGVDYSCQALYLDPGWDTEFGSFLWGEAWLGPRKEFIREIKAEYGLEVALHCPVATWMSVDYIMGPSAIDGWPKDSFRKDILPPHSRKLMVPAVRDGRRNLALLATAKPHASSLLANFSIRRIAPSIAHLNDGWHGNNVRWIASALPAWAEIDLGAVFTISRVRIGYEHQEKIVDRSATELRVLVATEYDPDSSAKSWKTVASYSGDGIGDPQAFGSKPIHPAWKDDTGWKLTGKAVFDFPPVSARWVRLDILKTTSGMPPSLDEIEIYEAAPAAAPEAAAFQRQTKRRPPPDLPNMPFVCLGSKQYLDEAEKRLLANCADGVCFLMFDGTWWNGGCANPAHGHPVPYTYEDHIRANVELARRVHARYPKVLIEMHDMIMGGSASRVTPVYYKYGLPGSYDENWGFELMWDPFADLTSGRARALYYYNLGCNVPIYLHIDLRKDNQNCIILWWYASTCRHLGIGGTHQDPAVVEAQQQAMKRYRTLEAFYKQGEFYGANEEIHVHVIPWQNAFVVNVFNLSDQPRTIAGAIGLRQMGLDPSARYGNSTAWASASNGELSVNLELPAWSTELAEFRAV